MGSQAYDLLDATMNIDAIDWKSAGEIKCQLPFSLPLTSFTPPTLS